MTNEKIKALKNQIDALRPLTTNELLELKKWYEVTYTFHSNAIEGNSLTLAETKIVVEDGLTVGGHPIREIIEAQNHKNLVAELIALVQAKKDITEKKLLAWHKSLISGIDNNHAGQYRQFQVYITGEEKLPPNAKKVPTLMKNFFEWYKKQKLDPVDLASETHYRLVKIHPFTDGNGRIARLIANLILMRAGYPLMIIPIIRRQEYIASLKSVKKLKDFQAFFNDILIENMKDYLRMIQ